MTTEPTNEHNDGSHSAYKSLLIHFELFYTINRQPYPTDPPVDSMPTITHLYHSARQRPLANALSVINQ